MRFAEFKKYLFEAESQPGYYTIGDSHAKGVADSAGQPWINKAIGGRASTDAALRSNISAVTSGSVVVVAVGGNDTANAWRANVERKVKLVDPTVIAGNVADVVNRVKAQQPKKVIFLLFPNGKGRTKGDAKWYNGDYQEDVRSAIKAAVSGVEMIDQNDYPISPDQVHSDWNVYGRIGKEIVQKNPLGSVVGTPATDAASNNVGPRDKNNPMRQGKSSENPNASGNPASTAAASAPAKEGEKFYIDVPTSRRGPAVRDVQQTLERLGYSVGPTGADGIRGKYTIRAVKAFQAANPPLEKDGNPGPETVGKLNAIIKANPEKFKDLVRSKSVQVRSGSSGNPDEGDVGDLMTDTDADIEKARNSAEDYLGRKMSDSEWTALLKVTAAEENDTEALGWVVGAILNRVKQGSWGDDVVSVVNAGGQFQPVTGLYDKVNKRWSGKGLPALAVPQGKKLQKIITAASEVLPTVPNDIINFTSNLKAAYGIGTNLGYRDELLKRGGVVKGNSVFSV